MFLSKISSDIILRLHTIASYWDQTPSETRRNYYFLYQAEIGLAIIAKIEENVTIQMGKKKDLRLGPNHLANVALPASRPLEEVIPGSSG